MGYLKIHQYFVHGKDFLTWRDPLLQLHFNIRLIEIRCAWRVDTVSASLADQKPEHAIVSFPAFSAIEHARTHTNSFRFVSLTSRVALNKRRHRRRNNFNSKFSASQLCIALQLLQLMLLLLLQRCQKLARLPRGKRRKRG